MSDVYSEQQQKQLLNIARVTLESVTQHQTPPRLDQNQLSPMLLAERACFVTLTLATTHELRGCTGTLVARNPLAYEVILTTEQTAMSDPRFNPVQHNEVDGLHIEISVLTPMIKLAYTNVDELLVKLRPNIDGVTLQLNRRRATFLPQVWERVPDKGVFLSMLCEKMGVAPQTWQKGQLEVFTYQSIIIEEPRLHH